MSTDIFCSGHSFLPDGSLYVTGGNDFACFLEFEQGLDVTNTFNPFTNTWTKLEAMSTARWYPTNVALGDGRVIILSGNDRNCEITPMMEMYSPGAGLKIVPEGARSLPMYPRTHLLTNGTFAYVGPGPDTYTFDPEAKTWDFVDNSHYGWRDGGMSILVPGTQDEIMIIGGDEDGAVTDTCERINISDPAPRWRPAGTLNFGRSHANVVILPDRNVLLVGGGDHGLYCGPINVPELYNPDTDSWTTLPPQNQGRMYHSTAVLLPDGRVLSAGQDSGESNSWGEVYEPAYLFRGPRPTIEGFPDEVAYGREFIVETPEASDVEFVVLIRPSAVTHSVNNEQRYVELEFALTGPSEITTNAPPNGNFAPPGYYMLFLVDHAGVPSEAQFIRLVD